MPTPSSRAETILSALVERVQTTLAQGGVVEPAFLSAWVKRNRAALLAMIEEEIVPLLSEGPGGNDASVRPDEWTAGKRTEANIRAMERLAALGDALATAADREVLRRYSGWGGLSIQNATRRFPEGIPHPDPQGLIHEFYTPTRVAQDVAAMIAPLVTRLAEERGTRLMGLEPSAGIGRFLAAMSTGPFLQVDWQAVEFSELSGRLLTQLFPSMRVFIGPFERWVRDHGERVQGRVDLLVSNPPYGIRGASIAEDPVRAYREKMAYRYFLRRGLHLLSRDGLAVFLVPAGFMSSKTQPFVELRQKVLTEAHLAAAFRLPSMNAAGRAAIFPGALLVTDLLIFRGRGGTLEATDSADDGIIAGDYYVEYPRHVLGKVVGRDDGSDDQTAKPRWGYQVQGDYVGLPALVERPICTVGCKVVPYPVRTAASAKDGKRVGGIRTAQEVDLTGYSESAREALALGDRVDRYLAALAEGADEARLLWPELVPALRAWVTANGSPAMHVEIVNASRGGVQAAARFLAAFDRTGGLISGLETPPPRKPAVFSGDIDDLAGQAGALLRASGMVTLRSLTAFHRSLGGALGAVEIDRAMREADWFIDPDGEPDMLLPAERYLTGMLWPRVDRVDSRIADLRNKGGQTERWDAQRRRLIAAIAPVVFDEIDGVSPRQAWIPMSLINEWIAVAICAPARYPPIEVQRVDGLLLPPHTNYEDMSAKGVDGVPTRLLWYIGWANHDKGLFRPPKDRDSEEEQDIDKKRLAIAAEWEASFTGFIGAAPERKALIEEAYNRRFRGFVLPTYSAEPLPVARWRKDGPIHPKPHQTAGARRIEDNRGGLVAFDVGVGKTLTGILVLARARQQGWARRPVVLVPNTVAFNWYEEIKRVLPDYRVGMIGVKRKVISRGARKGMDTSETDTAEERAQKWTRLQTGEYDAVICTYSAFPRTRLNEKAVMTYASRREAILREVKMRQRRAQAKKKLTEREEAILNQGVSAWVAEKLEIQEGWEYDPGIAWDDIGVDLLIVDEAQNFKNLYLPEEREGGVPRFMGNPGDGSDRSWQLDFRAESVRRHAKGRGIVLLSATPAKNSPLEFYNLLQYIDPDVWTAMGITDPEQFIDRYLRIELQQVITPSMEVEERGAVVGFQNLHELRDVLFRIGEFKTAEEVGLVLPEPTVKIVEVDMSAAQDRKYDRYVRDIEASLHSGDPSEKNKVLGLLARMALVAIHPALDEGYDWNTAGNIAEPSSPKFEALAENVLANRECGHIVFCDNVAAHRWIVETLVEQGIRRERIAVLNAKTAKAPADRQRIAREFNGNPDEGTLPLYDVVIANAIAYEGINLQTRTCAIHHIDLPWEPATLQQRNGRGVRQGNRLASISIFYYFARRSQDGLRFNLIQGKRGWMTQLIESQDRDTNNPGAQAGLGPDEVLLLISRDPDKTRKQLEAVRDRRRQEALAKLREEATRMLRSINTRFRQVSRMKDLEEAARVRGEAEARLRQLLLITPDAWPWAKWAVKVRDTAVVVTKNGMPLSGGTRIGVPNPLNPAQVSYAEFGAVDPTTGRIGYRLAGTPVWEELDPLDVVMFQGVTPAHMDPDWPEDEWDFTVRAGQKLASERLRYGADWLTLGWSRGLDEWRERAWATLGETIVTNMAKAPYYNQKAQRLPALRNGKLVIDNGDAVVRTSAVVLPPTEAGWADFLARASASGLKFSELADAGFWWWGRNIPRDLLSRERGGGGEAG